MKIVFSRQIFEKSSNIKFHENPFELFHADGRTDMRKLIVALRDFADAPKTGLSTANVFNERFIS
jgi:hypothetical protein